ncbi:hypothetical protein ACGFS9_16665 [Streptomyces sp. NPDC048566]|uniref:hypothetical protein n=1 Tax=Streptomyces sp. NPDC048566 TaxID=3365569 RepID=UPI0037242CA7
MSTVPPPEDPAERAGGESSGSGISDDQWDRFLRESAEGGGRAAPKEPSARARMVARRLREQDEQAAGEKGAGAGRRLRRRPAKEPEPWTPPGWRTGPAWQEMNGRSARRRTLRSVFGVALALAVAVVVVRPSLVTDRLPGREPAPSAAGGSPSPLPAETALPSGAPAAAGADGAQTATRAHPFRGSPAERWADGADGIELPAAKAVGGMSTADVALALRRTKDFLVGTALDPAVLRGGYPKKALALLEPRQSAQMAELRRSLRSPGAEHDPLGLVSRFDPSEVAVTGKVVKVRGHLSFEAGKPGQVRVHADYSFVYPLVRAGGEGDSVARTIVRRELTLVLSDPGKWYVTPGKLTLMSYAGEYFNSECDSDDGFYHPVFPRSGPTGSPGTGPAKDPYDRSQSVTAEQPEPGECGTTTRT